MRSVCDCIVSGCGVASPLVCRAVPARRRRRDADRRVARIIRQSAANSRRVTSAMKVVEIDVFDIGCDGQEAVAQMMR